MEQAKLFLMHTNDQYDLLDIIPFTLPQSLLNKALSFRRLIDKNNFVAARWMLYEYFRSADAGFNLNEIKYTSSGKPFISNKAHFSISHTKGLAGVLISDEPVGLDIEQIKAIGNFNEFDIFFTKEELSRMERLGLNAFFELWTIKEAVLKLTGEGITETTNVHSIRVENENAVFYNNQRFHTQSFVFENAFFITAAQIRSEETTDRLMYHQASINGNQIYFSEKRINKKEADHKS